MRLLHDDPCDQRPLALVVSGRGENDKRLPTTNGVREPQNRVKVVEDFVMSAAFSPDGLRHTARVRDAATGREIAVPRGLALTPAATR